MENLQKLIEQHIGGILHLEEKSYFVEQALSIKNCKKGITIYGNNAVITSGKELSQWKKRKAYYVHDAKDIHYSNQLYKNGAIVDRPYTAYKSIGAWEMYEDEAFIFHKERKHHGKIYYDGYLSTQMELLEYQNHSEIEFVYDVGWTHVVCPVKKIKKIDDTHIFIEMVQPAFRDAQIKEGMQIKSPNQLVNIKEMLQEGQWYFDRSSEEIIYYPYEGEEIDKLQMIIPLSDYLLQIEDSKDIYISDVTFSYSSWLTPSLEGLPDGQANLCKNFDIDPSVMTEFKKPAAAVIVNRSLNVHFEKCSFINIGCCAIDFNEGVKNASVRNSYFNNVAANGIMISQFNFKCGHEEAENKITENITIDNNYFENIGSIYKSGIAVIAGYLRHTSICHNTIHDVAYSGISLGWGWGFDDPNYKYNDFENKRKDLSHFTTYPIMEDNHIDYNHIYHVMQKMHDGAAIYTLSMNQQSTVIGNYVHDNGSFKGKPYDQLFVFRIKTDIEKPFCKEMIERESFPGGIYLDEGSGGFTVENNVICHVACPLYYHYTGIKGVFETNHYGKNYISDDQSEEAKKIILHAGKC